MIPFLLVGCVFDLGDKTADGDTGEVPTGSGAYGCVEDARTALSDTTVAADGMSFAPDDVVAAVSGPWSGTFTFVDGTDELAGFTVRADGGSWALVTRTLQGSGGGGMGAPDEECSSYYAWTTEAQLVDEAGAFDEDFAAEIDATAVDAVTLRAAVDLADVVGTTRPAAWDPADWARNTLAIDGTAADEQWTVSVLWQASSEASAKDEGSAGTGTVSASGMTEGVGTLVAVRAVE